MPDLDSRIGRWIHASAAWYFSETLTHHLHVDGKTRETEELTEWYELRVWRINKIQRTKDFWDVTVWIDIACMAYHDTNAYKLTDLIGEVESSMIRAFPLYQFDEVLPDPVVQLSCFDREEGPETIFLGEINSDLKLFQANVSCKYEVNI